MNKPIRTESINVDVFNDGESDYINFRYDFGEFDFEVYICDNMISIDIDRKGAREGINFNSKEIINGMLGGQIDCIGYREIVKERNWKQWAEAEQLVRAISILKKHL